MSAPPVSMPVRSNGVDAFARALSVRQRFNNGLHHRRCNAVSEQPDLVAASTVIERVTGGKSHCATELLDLKHPEHGLSALPRDQTETVQSRKSPERPVDG